MPGVISATHKECLSAVPGLVRGTVGGGIVIPDKYSHPYLCRTQIVISLCCKFVLLFVNISVDRWDEDIDYYFIAGGMHT